VEAPPEADEEPRSIQIRIVKQRTMETTRQQKIAKQIQKDVAEIFQKEGAALVRGLLVTVTGVRVSPDFGYAKIYVSVFPFDRSAELMKTLEHQNWFVRRALGQRLRNQLKNVPEIQFFLDDSLEYIEHIEQALK
jgi:ribosome-binding factor A